MEGKILKKAIDSGNYKIAEILNITGISRGQLYNLYKEEFIKEEYKNKIDKLKLNIDWDEKSTKSNENIDLLKLEISHLKEIIARVEQENVFLKSIITKPKVKGK